MHFYLFLFQKQKYNFQNYKLQIVFSNSNTKIYFSFICTSEFYLSFKSSKWCIPDPCQLSNLFNPVLFTSRIGAKLRKQPTPTSIKRFNHTNSGIQFNQHIAFLRLNYCTRHQPTITSYDPTTQCDQSSITPLAQ